MSILFYVFQVSVLFIAVLACNLCCLQDVYQMCKTLEKLFNEKLARMPAEVRHAFMNKSYSFWYCGSLPVDADNL